MILISHRGNLNGPNPDRENSPSYIDEAIANYSCEIDVRTVVKRLWLGHNSPEHEITAKWLTDRAEFLLVHCKDIETIVAMNLLGIHCFYQQDDMVVFTNKGIPVTHSKATPIKGGLWMMPEKKNDLRNLDKIRTVLSGLPFQDFYGICSDYVANIEAHINVWQLWS